MDEHSLEPRILGVDYSLVICLKNSYQLPEAADSVLVVKMTTPLEGF